MGWKIGGMILLWLLKIIGILLLLVLLFLAVALFVPVRYRFLLRVQEKKVVTARVTWLGFVLRLPLRWEEDTLSWKLRLLGIPILRSDRTRKNRTRKNRTRKNRTRNSRTRKIRVGKRIKSNVSLETDPAVKRGNSDSDSAVEGTTKKTRSSQAKRDSGASGGKNTDALDKRQSPLWTIMRKIREFFQKIRSFLGTVRQVLRKIREKVHSVVDLWELFQTEHAKRFVCIGKNNMVQLWKKMGPKKLRGDILFGTGDPCSTGQCLGAFAILYGWIGNGIRITPDFEEKRFEGYLRGKGSIRMVTALVIVIKIVCNKDFKQLCQELKQWKEEL